MRLIVEKLPQFSTLAHSVFTDLRDFVKIDSLAGVRVMHVYDVDFSATYYLEPTGQKAPDNAAQALAENLVDPLVERTFASIEEAGVEGEAFLVTQVTGQYDQRGDSAAQILQMALGIARPLVRTATLYVLEGELTEADVARAKAYLINPVESREIPLAEPDTLLYPIPEPQPVGEVALIDTDDAGIPQRRAELGLAMDDADLTTIRDYFRTEKREPSVTEIRVLDTYWSDHCRHTTFLTILDSIEFQDPATQAAYQNYLADREALGRTKPVTLMDLGTIGAKVAKAAGLLDKLDESDEVNACTVHVDVTVDGEKQPYLLLFKNETHNHPTEIEPFGGASTCIGGAIRDPLSGRGYVYGAIRLIGAGDPRIAYEDTRANKLPQRVLARTASAGYSDYGNQIGVAGGIVDEIYEPGYVAKRMELGAVVAAVPTAQVTREVPAPGDRVLMIGGRTGRDGIGGATGSSQAQSEESLEGAGAQVQKGDAPEERKIVRLFRDPEFSKMIKRSNDFGAGGVSVAVGELADGLNIDLDKVSVKYPGMDGTELAISESQERMAIVVAADDVARVVELAREENLDAIAIAEVTAEPRLVMNWRGQQIVNISREFLNTAGAVKHATAVTPEPKEWRKQVTGDFKELFTKLAGDVNLASKQGVAARFDSSAGANTVLAPYGGTRQATPIQAMAHTIPTPGRTDDVSVMAWGFNPELTSASPFAGGYLAVVESMAKLVASGAKFEEVYLSFQEFFEALDYEPDRWGKPVAALLGALEAQRGFGVGSVGGKDSMSGSFEELDVPPTLVSFAITMDKAQHIVPNYFKKAGNKVTVVRPALETEGALKGLPSPKATREVFEQVTNALRSGAAVTAYTPGRGGIAEAVLKMALGEGLGFNFEGVSEQELFGYDYASFVLEWAGEPEFGELLGEVSEGAFRRGDDEIAVETLDGLYTGALEEVYPTKGDDVEAADAELAREIQQLREQVAGEGAALPETTAENVEDSGSATPGSADSATAAPLALIPIFPGTNGEYETIRALVEAGFEVSTPVIKNKTHEQTVESAAELARMMERAQLLVLAGGAATGDHPEGPAKFIASFFRTLAREALDAFAANDSKLILGLGNGFQALVKLGLVPNGKVSEPALALAGNTIGHLQSKMVGVHVAGNSPWLAGIEAGVYTLPLATAYGRVAAPGEKLRELARVGQVLGQYVDATGEATMDIADNPAQSMGAIDALTDSSGRILGMMTHPERSGEHLAKNVPGRKILPIFEAARAFFK